MSQKAERSQSTDARHVSRTTLTTRLEDALRLDIIEGVLQPGQKLRAFELSGRYGVSATPLREALQRLAGQNLVDIDPHLGTTVAEVSRTDLRDIYDLREILESIALEQSIARGDERWEQNLAAAWTAFRQVPVPNSQTWTRESAMNWSKAHRVFHEALFEACGSPWLLRFISTLYDHSERYRMLSAWSPAGSRAKEHREVFMRAAHRDAQGAVAALRNHLEGTVDTLEKRIARTDVSDMP